jgi:hypothetical protein
MPIALRQLPRAVLNLNCCLAEHKIQRRNGTLAKTRQASFLAEPDLRIVQHTEDALTTMHRNPIAMHNWQIFSPLCTEMERGYTLAP